MGLFTHLAIPFNMYRPYLYLGITFHSIMYSIILLFLTFRLLFCPYRQCYLNIIKIPCLFFFFFNEYGFPKITVLTGAARWLSQGHQQCTKLVFSAVLPKLIISLNFCEFGKYSTSFAVLIYTLMATWNFCSLLTSIDVRLSQFVICPVYTVFRHADTLFLYYQIYFFL